MRNRFLMLLATLCVMVALFAALAAPAGAQGYEDGYGANTWGQKSLQFYTVVGYGAHHMEFDTTWNHYATGNFFCNSNTCYVTFYFFVRSGENLYSEQLYGDSWGDIYGWGGY